MREIKLNKAYKNIHFIGIGGVHMSALAEMLMASGYGVSGSDQSASAATQRLRGLGIPVETGGHRPENIPVGTDLVVYTAAVKPDNAELAEARARGIETQTRAGLLGGVMKNFPAPVCVAGTHGKTTVTAMLGEIFKGAGADPSVLIGGTLKSLGGAPLFGNGPHFIVESCEYCDSFLSFFPLIGIILNIEADHLDYFRDLAAIRASFAEFAGNIAGNGALVVNAGIENYGEITAGLKCGVVTFGMKNAGYTAEDIAFDGFGNARFTLVKHGRKVCGVSLSVPGGHNVLNALAALAAADLCGLGLEEAALNLRAYKGADRRFQFKGGAAGVSVFDDYAHHPTELDAAIKTARLVSPGRVWHVFQPHTHSRTKAFFNGFAESLARAGRVIILDVYSPAGREEPGFEIRGLDLAAAVNQKGGDAAYSPGMTECADFLAANAAPGDMVLTLGAGDVYRVGEMVLERLGG